jgi:hypothetical protein
LVIEDTVIEDTEAEPGTGQLVRRLAHSAAGRWLWPVTFAAVACFLLLRSAFLFTTPLHETADEASNSILVIQAQHFALLHGNYSREGFFHPGPAYLYVMAAGQWLFHDATHWVPTPWNGQLIAILLLNAALVATVGWIVRAWAGSVWAAVAAVAIMLGLAGAVDLGVPAVINRDVLAASWFPDLYVPTFLAFLVGAASVAAGRTAHLWLVAVTGSLLIQGHVQFLLFVPLVVAGAAVAALWPYRGAPLAACGRFVRERWPHYLPAVLVSAVFAIPIAVDLGLHWPGEFGLYLAYARSPQAGGHTLAQAVSYVLWYWAQGHVLAGGLVMAAAVAAALAVALPAFPDRAAEAAFPVSEATSPAGGTLRRFLLAALWICAVTTAGMLYYAVRGIDDLSSTYIGFFYWAVPVVVALVIAAGLIGRWPDHDLTRVAVAGVLAIAVLVGTISPGLRADVHDNEPALVPAMARVAALAHGRTVVLQVLGYEEFDAWALVLQAYRTGVPACLVGPRQHVFEVTGEFICGPGQVAGGVTFQLHQLPYKPQRGARLIATLRYAAVSTVP